jgi:hypothetical protein
VTLSDYLGEQGIGRVRLLTLDVLGFELEEATVPERIAYAQETIHGWNLACTKIAKNVKSIV